MKTKVILFTLLALWLFTAGSCNDDDDSGDRLPPITQVGANTAGYKLNGKVILPRQEISWNYGPGPKNPLKAYLKEETLKISIFTFLENKYGDYTSMSKKLYITSNLTNNENNISIYAGYYGNDKIPKYQNYSMIEGNLDFLKKDENSGIYAGTFNAKLKHEETGEILNITDGRFDINLNTLPEEYIP